MPHAIRTYFSQQHPLSASLMMTELEAEKIIIWREIRAASGAINAVGGNPVELLIWSDKRRLEEVRKRIEFVLIEGNMDEEDFRKKMNEQNEDFFRNGDNYYRSVYVISLYGAECSKSRPSDM